MINNQRDRVPMRNPFIINIDKSEVIVGGLDQTGTILSCYQSRPQNPIHLKIGFVSFAAPALTYSALNTDK